MVRPNCRGGRNPRRSLNERGSHNSGDTLQQLDLFSKVKLLIGAKNTKGRLFQETSATSG